MKRPEIDDKEINDYIDSIIEENDELKFQLLELKNKRSLDNEYRELVLDILDSSKEIYKIYEFEEDEKNIADFSNKIIRYIKVFLNDYKIRF